MEWGAQAHRPRCVEPADEAAEAEHGRLPPERIQAVVRGGYARFRHCYEAGLARHPRLSGILTIGFVIERDGRVGRSVVQANAVADCAVASCVRDEFRSLAFPPPEGGTVTVAYPLFLEPG